jgi:molybdopterin converting factor small subunit
MAVTLVFLGRLEDVAGMEQLRLEVVGPQALSAVLAQLPEGLAQALAGPKVKLALNGALLPPGVEPSLADGDELAFLPPVSGG